MMQHHDLLNTRHNLRKQHAPHHRLRVSAGTANNTCLCAPRADLETEHLLNVDARIHAGDDEAFTRNRLRDDVMAGRAGGYVVYVVGEEDGAAAHVFFIRWDW